MRKVAKPKAVKDKDQPPPLRCPAKGIHRFPAKCISPYRYGTNQQTYIYTVGSHPPLTSPLDVLSHCLIWDHYVQTEGVQFALTAPAKSGLVVVG